jgi:hypothetical protein
MFERKFEKIVFSSNISKIPEFILNKEMGRRKRSIEKKEKGRKISKSLSLLKKGNSIF